MESVGKAPAEAVRKFTGLKYGMFIHYGIYSMHGRNEWVLAKERMDLATYRAGADQLRPAPDCARAWIRLAAGNHMRYACLTTRHHDGFCLWDSQADSFTLARSACGRDLVREFVDACRDEGVVPCLYYSVGNWNDPGYRAGPKGDPSGWRRFVDVCHRQLRELMTNYGRIGYLFYDGCPPPELWDAAGANAMIRQLQPDILISNRCSLNEDVPSSEQKEFAPPGTSGFWEACYTIPRATWGWNRFDEDIKPPHEIARLLMSVVHRGGNLLLNIGPHSTGRVHEAEAEVIRATGRWLDVNGEAILGASPCVLDYQDLEISTGRQGKVYFGLFGNDYGPEKVIAGIGNVIKAVHVLGAERNVSFRQDGDRIYLHGLTGRPAGSMPRVICLEFDGAPRAIPNPYVDHRRFRTN
ncbi:MAG: alpha-L-fucosidase [Kiritimatiellae bacterium]|nr:alpha-L-fucosidase [Kiritimatiellia bacterium]